MRRIMLAMTFGLAACSEATLNEGRIQRGSAEAEAMQEPARTEESPALEESAPSEPNLSAEVPPPAAAMPPISIGGAYLSCNFKAEGEAACYAFNEQGKALSTPMEKAFVISGVPARWTATNFQSTEEANKYLIQIPNNASSDFGIAMTYNGSQAIMDWIGGNDPEMYNLLVDGSFESFSFAEELRYFKNEESPAWKAKVKADSFCPNSIGVLEIQQNPKHSTAHGTRRLELDAGCINETTPNSGNMIVHQEAQITAEHFYLLRFSYMSRPEEGSVLQKMRVTLNGEKLFEAETTDVNEWSRLSFVRKLNSSTALVEFEELGISNRQGTVIDAVQLIDLGPDPQLK